MGINDVFNSLLELFPEVDARALRAVAIEHSKDADAAVEAVLVEIIPLFNGTHKPSGPLNRNINMAESTEALLGATVRPQNEYVNCGNQKPFRGDYPINPFHDAFSGDNTAELTLLENYHESRMKMSSVVHSRGEPAVLIDLNTVDTLPIEISGASEAEETISGDKFSEINSSGRMTNFIQEGEDLGKVSNKEIDVNVRSLESSTQLVEVPDMHERSLGKSEVILSTDTTENESSLNATMTQSSQAHIMDIVEEIIAEARNNKTTLFLAMESVISLIKQIELKDQDLDQAKEEAVVGGKNTLDKAEELKRMLQHAKEANDMHSGEVYGEKAILATELRELQSRVLSLSDERDKSLTILEEMCKTLEVRLAAVENEIQSAEQEKLEKENAARKLLADQELIMEKVVQESKILKQQAEDNAKLQEFLVDRGRVVDMLQGEIAVICEDVRVLKEKFDEHVPLSKSLFSNQTSFILASSTSSSSKSLNTDKVEPVPVGDDLLETQEKGDYEQVPEEKASRDDRKALVDDGWEFFDEREINA